MANVPELFDIADQIQEDERRASLDQPGSSRPSTSTAAAAPQPTLEEEVNEVIGQFSRFWGGFQKQSQSVLRSASKDFRSVVETARKEASWLATKPTTAPKSPEPEASTSRSVESTNEEPTAPISVDTKGKEKEKEIDDDAATIKSSSPTTATTTTGNFFSRLQAALPPQFAPAAVTASLQNQLTSAQASADALRASLATNIQRIQQEGVAGSGPISLAQAEKLAEEYIKNAGAFLKDAVHVVPGEASETRGVVWDGSDIWMMPSPIGTPAPAADGSTSRPTLSHSEMLLRRLKHDPEVLKADPFLTPSVSERYEKYLAETDREGPEWTARIREVISETSEDSDALLATKELLVPSLITEDEFWKRYFFRVLQISEDEEKRKIILEAPTQSDDDFSWEDDDAKPASSDPPKDEPPTTSDLPPIHTTSSSATLKTPTNDQETSAATPTAPSRSASQVLVAHSGVSTSNTSPRESESSFDVVSASSSVAGAGEKRAPTGDKAKSDEKDDSDDSDWE
ncbi:BSD domain-containing protein [Ceratobasidium sp. AG-Ba]|nr:BSD domain-containing protein [Ceratobasidium sp. AG-Ba]